MSPALPHSPGASANLASLAQTKEPSGSSLVSRLVAGKHPFADAARHRLEPVSVPPRGSSLAADTSITNNHNLLNDERADGRSGNIATEPPVPVGGGPASSNPAFSHPASAHSASSSTTNALERQRQELVGDIASEARANKAEPLNEAGEQVFRDAGFEDRIGAKGSVDVDTRYLKPVIQETIIRKEHIEYQTVIDREVHIHHIYPKIQPIHDPDPVRLQVRHRMFSPRTGHWHEVIGDEAAIELLGNDAFRNGPQTYREVRRALLPGLDDTYEDQPTEPREARVIERENIEGVTSGHWHTVAGSSTAEDGKIIDGLEGLGEGVRTMHLTL